MKKAQFLETLRAKLNGLPKDDVDERISFYGEMIDDRIEEGLSEEEAVAKIGTVDEVVSQIVAETPWTKIVKEKLKPQRRLSTGAILLIVFGFPLWFPLLISAVAVAVSLYVVFWSVIISLWSVFVALVASAFGVLVVSIIFFCTTSAPTGGVAVAAALVCAGLAIFTFYGCMYATKGTLSATKSILSWTKNWLVKGGVQ